MICPVVRCRFSRTKNIQPFHGATIEIEGQLLIEVDFVIQLPRKMVQAFLYRMPDCGWIYRGVDWEGANRWLPDDDRPAGVSNRSWIFFLRVRRW